MVKASLRSVLAGVIIVTFVAPGVFAQQALDEIVARVGNEIILKSDLEAERKAIRDELGQQQGLQGGQLEQAFQERSKHVLRDLIDTSLLTQQAKELGISGDLEVVKAEERMRQEHNRTDPKSPINTIDDLEKEIAKQMSLDDFKQRIKAQYLRSQVLNREVYGRVVITNEELRSYYDEHKSEFDRPAGVHIREISANTQGLSPADVEAKKKKIDDALAAVKKGDDFGEIALRYSESETAQNGGDLGFFEKGQLAKDLEDLVTKLDKGQTTDVIKIASGFMILKLEDKHNGGIMPFESVQNEVYNRLFSEKVTPKIREYLTKLREDGFVEVKEGYLDTGAVAKK